jgi:hypothetical protein
VGLLLECMFVINTSTCFVVKKIKSIFCFGLERVSENIQLYYSLSVHVFFTFFLYHKTGNLYMSESFIRGSTRPMFSLPIIGIKN